MRPLVSVIVPVFNGAVYLDAALQSVWRQEIVNLQLIVIDDGSTDETPEIIARYGTAVTAISQVNQGPAAARNAGLRQAGGEFVAFLDADDEWIDGRLNRQLEYLRQNPTVDVVQGQIQYIRQINERWQPHDEPFFALSLVTGLFRRQVFEHIGLLDTSLPYCEDVDWFFRAQKANVSIQQQSEVALYYRRHQNNLTNRRDLIDHYMLRVVLKHKRTQAQFS